MHTTFQDEQTAEMARRLIATIDLHRERSVRNNVQPKEILALRVFDFSRRSAADSRLLCKVYEELRRLGVVGFDRISRLFWLNPQKLEELQKKCRVVLQPA